MYRFLFKYGRAYFPAIIAINLLIGISVPVQALIIKNIIDSAASSQTEFRIWLLLFLGLQAVNIIISKMDGMIHLLLGNTLELEWGKVLLGKCTKIKYEYFEQPNTFEVIDRLASGFKNNAVSAVDIIPITVKLTASVLGIFYLIFQASWWIVILLIATSFPVWFFSIKAVLNERDTFMESYQFYLKSKYFSYVLNSREYIKESRLFHFTRYISNKWSDNLIRFQKGVLFSNLKQRYLAGTFVFLQYVLVTVVIFALLYPLGAGALTIGAFVAIAQVLWGYVGTSQYQIIDVIQKTNYWNYFIKDYNVLMHLDEFEDNSEIKVEENFAIKSIVLRDVWYKYKEDAEYVLKGVNMTINGGETIALVGKNGSGKTTLIKLILGLLQPVKGEILINGLDVNKIDMASRNKLISVIFQDFAKYNILLRENIGISDIQNMNDRAKIEEAIQKSGIDADFLKAFPKGLETLLGKNINEGSDISGGQWQMIAIARALFSKAPLMMMDEPTASLDPLAEVNVYSRISEAALGKTVIFVTHRLGSTRRSDRIFVLDDGVIAEGGSHSELMERGGIYAEMYGTQRQWYE